MPFEAPMRTSAENPSRAPLPSETRPCLRRSAKSRHVHGLQAGLLLAILLILCVICGRTARAGVADAPGSDLQVALLTYGPGRIYWERFGHDALELTDTRSGEAIAVNYGVFDFNQKNFLFNFARGDMTYMIDAEYAAGDIAWYRQQGRWVQRQVLALTPAQASRLRDFLMWNLAPGNRNYAYDYYTSNCTTRVRDALNLALGGTLEAQMQGSAGNDTYRRQTDRLMAAQPWLMLLLDLGLGPRADPHLDQWRESFIPMVFMRHVAHIRVPDGHGGTRPLVASSHRIVKGTVPAPPRHAPNLLAPLLATGIGWGLALLVSGILRRRNLAARIGFGILGTVYALAAGLAGLFMLLIWTLTSHHAGWANQNLLLFNPLAFGLLPAFWKRHTAPWMHRLSAILLLMAAISLLLKLLPVAHQHNAAWIALALSMWLAIVIALWRTKPPAISRHSTPP